MRGGSLIATALVAGSASAAQHRVRVIQAVAYHETTL